MVDVGLHDDLDKGNQQAEQHPYFNQLYVSSFGQGLRNTDEPKEQAETCVTFMIIYCEKMSKAIFELCNKSITKD